MVQARRTGSRQENQDPGKRNRIPAGQLYIGNRTGATGSRQEEQDPDRRNRIQTEGTGSRQEKQDPDRRNRI
jgi:hypothetical protein